MTPGSPTGKTGEVAFEQLGVEFPVDVVAERHQHRRPEVLPRHRSAPPSASGRCKQVIDRVVDTITAWGIARRLLRRRRRGRGLPRRAQVPDHQPAGRLQLAGVVQHRGQGRAPAGLGLLHPRRSTTRWTPSSTGTSRRARSSRAAPAPASTSSASAPPRSCSRAAAPPRARSASCAAPTPRPAPSSAAARPAAPPRWSSSTSTTPTSRSSSGASPVRRRRPGPSRPPASTWTSTAPTSHSIQYQNANNSVRVTDEFMQAVVDDADWNLRARHRRRDHQDDQGPRPHAPDLPGRLGVRRSRHAVRHHDQPLAHRGQHRSDQRLEPVLGVHAPRQLGVQPGQPQPADLPRRGGHLRRRGLQGRRRGASSPPRRSWSATPTTRPSPSARPPAGSASSASATPTSAPC